ncbi:MAG: type I restriction endonuclease subunit R, partial [Symploca sp. SIO2D2]|nr:type I restriction endonuclease subunit R [Symploca sp. SIO2D2]
MPYFDPDEAALEEDTITLFSQLSYTTANCYREWHKGTSNLGRENQKQVILTSQLHQALVQLNPDLPPIAIDQAITEISKDRSTLSLGNANREIYQLLKDGVKVSYREENEETREETVTIINWQQPKANHFFLASQFWISGDFYHRRTDLLGFVNGIPLVFIELKNPKIAVSQAYEANFRDYLNTIPQLFHYNGLVILSNGSQAKLGTITSRWSYFSDWPKINSEGEAGRISLETMIRGTCTPAKLLDLVENFTLFKEEKGKVVKLIARNHQYLGVNNAVAAVANREENQGKLGVFWHTQGSGKSYSMQFLSQKVKRKLPGNWTF